ncbi:hypothetical protein E2C01_031251 [Portunus trituberculatus]|uniref:Uncharacterized protein n=1 Tax=Portunus trituberculatus TaxID=210409 RepID=A0A5B7EU08_PORTR|nr:hypothetical protein [Portunus trituberculatus]
MTTAGNIKINHNIDVSLLPPSFRALEQHVRRANYQMALWRRSHVAIFDPPSPTDGQDLEGDDLDSEFEDDVDELTLCSESEEEL